jgi:hypothetical protein
LPSADASGARRSKWSTGPFRPRAADAPLTSDTKIAEHKIQQLFHIHHASDAADGAHRQPQIFRQQFGLIARRSQAMLQMS